MGDEKIGYRQNYVIDFLYKDMSLINSFYSQHFNGTLSSIVKKEMSCDESSQEGNVGLGGIFGGKVSSNESINKAIESNIDPMDVVIIELMNALQVKIFDESLENIDDSGIFGLKGNLMFRNYNVINDLLPIITDSNLVPEFNNPVNPNAKGKDRKFTMGKMIQKFISVLPFGLEFEILTKNEEHVTAIIKDEYLTIKPSDLIRMYGLTLPGEWTAVGILDKASPVKFNSKSEFKNSIDIVTELYYQSMNEDSSGYILRPIVIYRKVQSN